MSQVYLMLRNQITGGSGEHAAILAQYGTAWHSGTQYRTACYFLENVKQNHLLSKLHVGNTPFHKYMQYKEIIFKKWSGLPWWRSG